MLHTQHAARLSKLTAANRASFSTVPQKARHFSGTARLNLDKPAACCFSTVVTGFPQDDKSLSAFHDSCKSRLLLIKHLLPEELYESKALLRILPFLAVLRPRTKRAQWSAAGAAKLPAKLRLGC